MLKLNRKSPFARTFSSLIGFFLSFSSLAAVAADTATIQRKQTIRHQQQQTKKTPPRPISPRPGHSRKTKPNLSWWAIKGGELTHAACLRKAPFTDEEMIEWLNAYAQQGEPPVAETRFNGIQFVDESPALIRLFKDLITYTGYNFDRAAEKPLPFSSSCTKVICAAEDVFGKKTGIQLLYMLGRFGVNGSHLVRDRAQKWYPDELDEVLVGFAAYPDSLQQIYYNHPFVHYERDIQMGDAQLGHQTGDANGLYSEWNTQNPRDRFISVVHERAHHFSKIPADKTEKSPTTFYHFDKSPEWYRLSGWTSEDNDTQLFDLGPFHLGKPVFVPSVYGRTNPREDFAESVLKYRFNPQGFLEMLGSEGRAKYDYIRNVIFQGVEFLSEEQCKGSFNSVVFKSGEKTEQKPATPSQPEPPKTLSTSEAPSIPEAPQVPVTPDAPQTPASAEAPHAPVTPDAPQVPVTPDAPQVPVTPDAPHAPVTPDAPQVPVTPDAPHAPVTPDAPHAPVTPDAPQVPVTPDAPHAPVTPDAPHAPVTPVAPHTPASAEAPQVLLAPEMPQDQAASEAPLSPNIPQIFRTPTITQTPQSVKNSESPEPTPQISEPATQPAIEPSPLPSLRVSAQHPLERMENLVQFLNHNLEIQLQQAASRLRELFRE